MRIISHIVNAASFIYLVFDVLRFLIIVCIAIYMFFNVSSSLLSAAPLLSLLLPFENSFSLFNLFFLCYSFWPQDGVFLSFFVFP